jgi:MFS family permease
MTVLQVAGLIAGPIAGHLSDKIGRQKVVLSSMLLTGVTIIGMVFAGQSLAFIVFVALVGFFLYAMRPVMQAWAVENTPKRLAGTGVGLQFTILSIGGSIGPAKEGKLIGFVGGEPAHVEQARPLIDQMCRKWAAVGAHGNGARMKLAVNLPLMVYWQTLGEALSLVQSLDIDPKVLVDVLSESSGGPNMLKVRGGMIADALAGTPQSTVTVDLATMRKDVRTMVEQGTQNGYAMPLTQITLDHLNQAIEQGLAGSDCSQFPVWWLKR